jgi:hypothetical protein
MQEGGTKMHANYLHILADVLSELNKLDSCFQKENISLTTLCTMLE